MSNQNQKENELENRKRSHNEVIIDILKVIYEKNNKIKPTHLMYKANLSHRSMKDYLGKLLKNNLVRESKSSEKKMFELTDKGKEYYIKSKQLIEFQKTFGL